MRHQSYSQSAHDRLSARLGSPLRWFIFVATVCFLLMSFSMATNPARLAVQKPQAHNPAALVCVVFRGDSSAVPAQGNMDAVVLIENGKLRQPFYEYNEAAQRKFASEYFATGKKYRMTFGGGEVGSATVKAFDTGCNNIHATATISDDGRIPAHLSALATNSDLLGRTAVSRRVPTDAERTAVNLLVAQIYRSRGATRAWLRTVVTTNLTATDLDGDGKFELIGSYTAQSKTKARKDLLVILEPAGATFKPTLVKFQSYQLPPEGFDSAKDFVDQLDLDGDGIAEVFVRQHGFDAYGYAIYKKTAGRWRQVYTTSGDAC